MTLARVDRKRVRLAAAGFAACSVLDRVLTFEPAEP
jgi:hypothetical protein